VVATHTTFRRRLPVSVTDVPPCRNPDLRCYSTASVSTAASFVPRSGNPRAHARMAGVDSSFDSACASAPASVGRIAVNRAWGRCEARGESRRREERVAQGGRTVSHLDHATPCWPSFPRRCVNLAVWVLDTGPCAGWSFRRSSPPARHRPRRGPRGQRPLWSCPRPPRSSSRIVVPAGTAPSTPSRPYALVVQK